MLLPLALNETSGSDSTDGHRAGKAEAGRFTSAGFCWWRAVMGKGFVTFYGVYPSFVINSGW